MSTGTYEYKSDFARKYYFRGKAEAKAQDVLAVLAARGIAVPDEARDQITACTEIDQLDEWLLRAATAEGITNVLD